MAVIIVVKEFQTYKAWLSDMRARGMTKLDGDVDIACAFAGDVCIGQWDGGIGEVYEKED